MIGFFSKEELNDFERYVKVQKSGKYNMFDPRARQQTGLTKERFLFVIENYSNMNTKYLEQKEALK